LKHHSAWLKDSGPDNPKLASDPRKANLCGADLEKADLQNADLENANLFDADLDGEAASETGGADLRGADLTDADLTDADLTDADLSKAKLANVDLTDATYAPVSEPPDPYVAGIKGFATLKAAIGEEIGLIQLRKVLQDAGLSDSAREAAYSIQRNITRDQLSSHSPRSTQIEGWLRTVGFERTTAYGLHPEWGLWWILWLSIVLTPAYILAVLHPTKASGIIRVFPADRLDGTAGSANQIVHVSVVSVPSSSGRSVQLNCPTCGQGLPLTVSVPSSSERSVQPARTIAEASPDDEFQSPPHRGDRCNDTDAEPYVGKWPVSVPSSSGRSVQRGMLD
jgi:hypothetical protein